MKLNLGRYSKARFGQYYEARFGGNIKFKFSLEADIWLRFKVNA